MVFVVAFVVALHFFRKYKSLEKVILLLKAQES